MDADNLVQARMNRPGSSIRAILENAAHTRQSTEKTEPEAAAEVDLIPRPGDSYCAHARPSVRPERTLFLVLADGTYDGFPWSSFDRIKLLPPKRPGAGPSIMVRFAGSEVVEVHIAGRNLHNLLVYLGQNRIGWVREHPIGKPVVTTESTIIESIFIKNQIMIEE